MRLLRRGSLGVLVMLLMASSAAAAPITLSAGETVTFNFDFIAEGVLPAPSYDEVIFATDRGAIKVTSGGWEFFSELNGAGVSLFTQPIGLTDLSSDHPLLLDGVFSAVLTVVEGSITVDPTAIGIRNDVRTTPVSAQTTVPEPATLTLVTGGLSALLLRRHRGFHRSNELGRRA